jgi:hypothetical protein
VSCRPQPTPVCQEAGHEGELKNEHANVI